MDQAIRNQLQRATQAARTLLEQEFAAQLEGTYDILPDGTIAKKAGPHLDGAGRLVRGKLVEAVQHRMAGGQKAADAVGDYSREAAFTCLNRFVALKMLEARELVQTCVSKGDQSGGFREFCGLAPGLSELPDGGYQLYLECLFDELSTEVKVLFDRRDPASLLWPRRQSLLGLLEILNQPELAGVWIEDETIGWVYQYFNSQEERRQMREESQAPRNSRELAVRNQFFTPRYVVQFLTDNTLGRIWYEMRQGRTSLVEKCQYLVRRPDEVFLGHMTSADEEFPAEGCIEMAKLLQEGDESVFAAFDARDPRGIQRRIDLGHCVDGYERHPAGEEATWQWMHETQRAVQRAADLSEFSTQDLLDFLFLTCRNDRATDGNGCEQDWYVKAANEVRRRALRSREADLSQEELLRQPVFVFRSKKDPRDLKILDPACGSGHFLLYCFDLLQTIYEEKWSAEVPPTDDEERIEDDGEEGAKQENLLPLRRLYPTVEQLRAAVPSLILEYNLHGIDIDPRCAQIAAFALWMRAQRAYNDLGLERDQRLPIRKTNIVVAEPMPGEEDMFEDFLTALREDRLEGLIRRALKISPHTRVLATKAMADSLCALVRAVWNKMKLAGEAGSLLEIEQELATAVAAGRAEWEEKLPLFRMTEYGMGGEQREKYVRFVPGVGDGFWHKAEKLALDAIRALAQATVNGLGFRRRLFVDDAERGFAFVDLCRGRYDAVLMNPPFGEIVQKTRSYVAQCYTHSCGDIFQCFVDRAIRILAAGGRVGVISARTGFFLGNSAGWRENIVFPNRLECFADLGLGVLDSALVEVAAYVIEGGQRSHNSVFCNRQLDTRDKQPRLLDAVVHATNELRPGTYLFDQRLVALVPDLVFTYWAPPRLLRRYSTPRRFGTAVAPVRQGVATADDFRFARLGWEVPADSIGRGRRWMRFSKGGEYSPFYDDIHLLVDWGRNGSQLKAFPGCFIRNESFYFRPGATYTVRTASAFAGKVLPAECVFSHNAQSWFPASTDLALLSIAYLACRVPQAFLELAVGAGDIATAGSAARRYTTAVVESVPSDVLATLQTRENLELATRLYQHRINEFARDETTCHFADLLLDAADGSIAATAERRAREDMATILAQLRHSCELDRRVSEAFGLSREEEEFVDYEVGCHPCSYSGSADTNEVVRLLAMGIENLMEEAVRVRGSKRWFTKKSYFVDRKIEVIAHLLQVPPDEIRRAAEKLGVPVDIVSVARDLLSQAVGVAFGRWQLPPDSIEDDATIQHDPFTPLPNLPPAAVDRSGQNRRKSLPPPDGIFVDDPGHKADLAAHVRDVFAVVWGDQSDGVVRELEGILGADLRDGLAKGFFDDHIKRYSKSRRKAPVYWQLATSSGSYAVWLYYHKLNRDTFFKVVGKEFLGEKLEHEEGKLARMRSDAGINPTGPQTKNLEAQEAFVAELTIFRDESKRIAPLWNPDLNDGVIINFAPLSRLVPQHKAWQKECKECWDSLVAGEYDWAHLAMHLWPERVVPKCRNDRSLAIAHGLEDLLWVEDDGRWRPLGEPDDEIEDQKKRRRLTRHGQLCSALAALAQSASANLTAAELWRKLGAGDLDDTEAALLLWPGRVVEKCVMDPRLADKLHVVIPKRKTETAVAKLIKRYEADGCGHLAEAVGRALSGCNTAYPAVWKSLETGDFDDQPLALALWPDRVVDKCVADRVLAEKQGLTQFFWYVDPWSKAWRRRQSPDVEVADEIAHRHKPAVKAALESLLSTPSPTGGKKKRRKK